MADAVTESISLSLTNKTQVDDGERYELITSPRTNAKVRPFNRAPIVALTRSSLSMLTNMSSGHTAENDLSYSRYRNMSSVSDLFPEFAHSPLPRYSKIVRGRIYFLTYFTILLY